MDSAGIRFQKSPHFKPHSDTVVSDSHIAACDAAIVSLTEQLPAATSPEMAAANAYRIEGAKLFRFLLTTLGEAPAAPVKRPSGNLNPT